MRKLILILMIIPFFGFAQDNERRLLHMWELKIKNGMGQQFSEGMKAYKECYQENTGTDQWNVWNRMQGEGQTVVVTSYMDNWAEMDDESPDPAGEACTSIFMEQVVPNVEVVNHNIAGTMPDWSRAPEDGNKIVWVTFFDVNNSTAFSEVVEAVQESFKEYQGQPLGYWYAFAGGGPTAPTHMVSRGFKNWAEMDEESMGPWEALEKKHGKEKAMKMRDQFREALDDSWSYVYTLNEDLSITGN